MKNPVRISLAVTVVWVITFFHSSHALDGSALVVEAGSWFGRGRLVRVDLPSQTRVVLDSDGSCFGACFSPDGKKVVYSKSSGIWICDRDGNNKVNQNVPHSNDREPGMNWVSLADGEYIYWSEQSQQIYRTKIGSGSRETVYTSGARLYIISVSKNATRAACSKEAWSVWGIDISSGAETSYGGGCQGTVSPSGTYVTHNLGNHTQAAIHPWGEPGTTYKTVTTPWGVFNKHRFSKHSDDYIVFNVCNDNGGSNPQAYLANIHTNEKTQIGSGDPWDFFPGSVTVNPTVAAPVISPDGGSFAQNSVEVTVTCATSGASIRYTVDGSDPGETHGTVISSGGSFDLAIPAGGETTVKARAFKDGHDPSAIVSARFFSIQLREPDNVAAFASGLEYKEFHGTWTALPEFSSLTPVATGTIDNFDISVSTMTDNFGLLFSGYIEVQQDGLYTFYTSSDDGSRLFIGTNMIVDNDGQHAAAEESGTIGLKAGKHAIRVEFFQAGGGEALDVLFEGPGQSKAAVPLSALFRVAAAAAAYTITHPNGGEILNVGETVIIRWTSNLDLIGDAALMFSPDGGDSWVDITDGGSVNPTDPHWENFPWTIPPTAITSLGTVVELAGVTEGMIKIKEYMGSDYYDESDGMFTVVEGMTARTPATGRFTGSVRWLIQENRIVVRADALRRVRVVDQRGRTVNSSSAGHDGSAAVSVRGVAAGLLYLVIETNSGSTTTAIIRER